MIATHTASPTSALKAPDRSLAFYHSVFGAEDFERVAKVVHAVGP
jgi:hypothetical protein